MASAPSRSSLASPSSSFSVGTLVIYDQDGQSQLGVVLAPGEKKVRILTMREREVDLPAARLDILPGSIPSEKSSSKSESARYLLELREEALAREKEVPLEEIWSFVEEENREFSVSELTELYYGENSTKDHLILRIALSNDRIFFKRKKFSFAPRTISTIEELKKAEEARREKEENLKKALKECSSRKGSLIDTENPPEDLSETTVELLRLLARVAAGAGDITNNELKEIGTFLEHYEAKTHSSLGGGREERAYNFLRKIGWFHKNTNLSYIRHDLRSDFPEEVQVAAENLTLPQEKLEGRLDLSALESYTIDDAETKDMDDALSFEPHSSDPHNSTYRIGVHITDVASLIPIGSPLDREAQARATSMYFPEQTVHMFPPAFSQDLGSLIAGETRLAVSCFLTFSHHHELLESSLHLSHLSVHHKYSYPEIDELLDPPSGAFGTFYQITTSSESQRIANGGVKIPKRQVKIAIEDPQNLATSDFSVQPFTEQTPARDLVGEMMILANQEMGRFARDHDIPFIYRSQPPSDPDSEKRLHGVPAGPALDAALRSTLKRSVTDTNAAPHATLGVDCYAQVTSPIRRYTDLVNQRQLVAYLQGEPLPYSKDDIEDVLIGCSDGLQRARVMSRETHRFWILKYLKRKADRREQITGTVVRNDGPQHQVELDEVFIPVLFKPKQKLQRGDRISFSLQKVDPRYDYLKIVPEKTVSE
jgi:exoribonuclease-2